MTFKTRLYRSVLPAAAWLLVTVYSRCIRLQVLGREHLRAAKASGRPVIFAFLHGRQFLVYRLMGKKNIAVMSSTSRDGRLQAAILEKFGFKIAWGSSAKSPVRALMGMIKLMKQGSDSIMAVDGPRGPLYEVKPGILFLAKKMDAVIVPFVFSARRAVIMKAWDKYMLPFPFTRTAAVYGEPFFASEDASKQTTEKECARLQGLLLNTMAEADRLSGFNR